MTSPPVIPSPPITAELLAMADDGFRHELVDGELTEGDVLDGAEVVPGWTLPLRELFV
ncbi:MAG TPA: hypothetical protein VE871_11650 [Longimicrobium sp.]|nr:hypothetical protein [Longimicrobium sp.]